MSEKPQISAPPSANAAQKGKDLPTFDHDAHFGEVFGVEGVRYVQGRNYFGHKHQFVREAPRDAWLAPLTEEQERARQKQMRDNRKFFGNAKTHRNEGAIPQAVLDAERENSQARAAEDRAA